MKRLIAATIVALALAFAASAVANVLIYQNGFGKKRDVQRVSKLQGGGKCKSSWKGKRALGLRVNKGNKNCLFRTPVEGDSKQPDHTIQALGKVLKKTNKKVRDKVYVGVALRANRRSGYEIRVFPKGRRYELLKNGDAVRKGKNRDIKPLDKRNQIRLGVSRNTVVAKVNGKRVAKFTDKAAEEVSGRKTAVAFGSEAKANKDGFGIVDKIKVFVPTP
ncbi:MAG TPA: hypothetical protein VKA36_04440 [Solirubrobacterales bacterium]|nr:hypothetical protein [Solirubrobacterales bacterium]